MVESEEQICSNPSDLCNVLRVRVDHASSWTRVSGKLTVAMSLFSTSLRGR